MSYSSTRETIVARAKKFTPKVIDSTLMGESIKLRQPTAWEFLQIRGDTQAIELLLLCAEDAEGRRLFSTDAPTDPFDMKPTASDRHLLASVPLGYLNPAAADVMGLVWEGFTPPPDEETEKPLTNGIQPPSPN